MTERFPFLDRKVGTADLLVFFDFEGSSLSHHAIAIGVVAFKKENSSLLPTGKAFSYRRYIQSPEKVGPVVERLTGITDDLLAREGVPFLTMLKELNDCLRPYKRKAYLSYSDMDLHILSRSVGKTTLEQDFLAHVRKSYVDFHRYLGRFLVDPHGQSLSVGKLMDRLGLKAEGTPHDPLYDSTALAMIYERIVSDQEAFLEWIRKDFVHNRNLHSVERKLALMTLEKGSVTTADLLSLIKEEL